MLKVVVIASPTLAFAIAFLLSRLLSREDLFTAVSDMGLPMVIIQTLMVPLALYWKKKEDLKQPQNQSS